MRVVVGEPFGPYRIVRELGSGGMGAVYEATRDDRTVALKVLTSVRLRKDIVARFEREAKVCASLHHPHVVAVTDHGVASGAPYLEMPRLVGDDLDELVTRQGPLDPDVAVTLILQAASGLAEAHARGIVHRDVKPSNVFLERETMRAILLDFGIAKVADEDGSLTASGVILGTPLYMAPEQLLDSKRVDLRCDVWSIAMTLYFALAGKNPFANIESHGQLILALSSAAVPPLQEHAPWIDGRLARVVHAALLPRDDRFPDIDSFVRALREVITPVTISKDTSLFVREETKSRTAEIAALPRSFLEMRPASGNKWWLLVVAAVIVVALIAFVTLR